MGRKSTPSAVEMVSGTLTSTQAIAQSLSSPAEPIDRVSSRMFATVVNSHSRYWCMEYPDLKMPIAAPMVSSDREMA